MSILILAAAAATACGGRDGDPEPSGAPPATAAEQAGEETGTGDSTADPGDLDTEPDASGRSILAMDTTGQGIIHSAAQAAHKLLRDATPPAGWEDFDERAVDALQRLAEGSYRDTWYESRGIYDHPIQGALDRVNGFDRALGDLYTVPWFKDPEPNAAQGYVRLITPDQLTFRGVGQESDVSALSEFEYGCHLLWPSTQSEFWLFANPDRYGSIVNGLRSARPDGAFAGSHQAMLAAGEAILDAHKTMREAIDAESGDQFLAGALTPAHTIPTIHRARALWYEEMLASGLPYAPD